ncbi:sugar ABC transporter ATP-binding protein [Jiangella endophytica]|uniref:sugar ABC transporter ATP-binding protein n=1 Tax=Jiangella endophytica TaxID=1623398 RepID=UPI000E3510BE|nr:sugar ABC transporter ATP-binding protein [Jiangella endophytica]
MTTARTETAAVVELAGVGAAYGPTTVLRDVDLALHGGQITGLLGANGAGKSTLIKVLSGLKPEHPGAVRVDGADVALSSPVQAGRLGVATVHQNVADGVVPGLSVAENLLLDELAGGAARRVVTRGDTLRRARPVLATLGLDWSDAVLRADAGDLAISDAQLLVLARVLHRRPRLLILDEPTSTLTAREASRLFDLLRTLRDDGLAIVYVSHRFGEVESLADRVVVLRDGTVKLDVTRDAPTFDWAAILRAMLGREIELDLARRAVRRGDGTPAATVRGVALLPDAPPVDLDVRRGEVLAVLGLIGAGKTELAETLAGARPVAGDGTLTLAGRPYAPRDPAAAIAAGVVLVPEDRRAQGLFPGWTLARNVSAPFLAELSRWAGVLSRRAEAGRAAQVIAALDVRGPGPHALVDELSGGNQQKVVVGRWLGAAPALIVLDEPFRGVDLGARRDIAAAVGELAHGGAAAVVCTSDVDEALEVADRVVVLVEGRVSLDAYIDEVSHDDVVAAFLGQPGAQG